MSFRVAVVGATGAVGREILKTLSERNFPISEVAALASGRSAGSQVSFGEDQVLTVKNLDKFDFTGWDIALFSPGASISDTRLQRASARAGKPDAEVLVEANLARGCALILVQERVDELGERAVGAVHDPQPCPSQLLVEPRLRLALGPEPVALMPAPCRVAPADRPGLP